MLRGTRLRPGMAEVVVDASAMVDLLLGNDLGAAVRQRLTGHALHAPAHLGAEVLSALGRLNRAGELSDEDVETRLRDLAAAPIRSHEVSDLVLGAWSRRHQLRLADALYVELAVTLVVPLVTTDRRLRSAPAVDVVAG